MGLCPHGGPPDNFMRVHATRDSMGPGWCGCAWAEFSLEDTQALQACRCTAFAAPMVLDPMSQCMPIRTCWQMAHYCLASSTHALSQQWSLLSRCSVQHIAMQLCIAAMSWACECLIVIFVGIAFFQAVQLHHDWPSGTCLNVAFAALDLS